MGQSTQQQPPPPPAGDDLNELLARRERTKRSPVTLALVAVVLVAVGVLAGILVGRSMNNSTQASGFPGFRNGGGFPNGGSFPSGGPGGAFANGGNITFGTIESVNGNTITVRTQSGDTVNVKVGNDTQIRVSKDGSISDLANGDTIVVGGSKNGSTVDATTITEGGVGLGGRDSPNERRVRSARSEPKRSTSPGRELRPRWPCLGSGAATRPRRQ